MISKLFRNARRSRKVRTHRKHVVIAERFIQRLQRDALSVMHVAFVWIISKDSVDNNANLTICEPSLGTEPCLGSDGGGRHKENCRDADRQSDETFDQEEPVMCQRVSSNRKLTCSYHLQPSIPCTPLMRRRPKAVIDVINWVPSRATEGVSLNS